MALLKIRDENGKVVEIPVLKGDKGDSGEQGISPTVVVTEIEGGHRVTIADVNGEKSFDILDGESMEFNPESFASVEYVDNKIGDIDTALDNIIAQQESIIAIQNALIGGESV